MLLVDWLEHSSHNLLIADTRHDPLYTAHDPHTHVRYASKEGEGGGETDLPQRSPGLRQAGENRSIAPVCDRYAVSQPTATFTSLGRLTSYTLARPPTGPASHPRGAGSPTDR